MHLRPTTLIRHNNEASMVETRTRLRLLSALYILATLNFLVNHFVYHPSSANNIANLRTNTWKKTIATFPSHTVFSETRPVRRRFLQLSNCSASFNPVVLLEIARCGDIHQELNVKSYGWASNKEIIINKNIKKQSNQQQQRTKFKQFGFLKDKSTTAQLLQSFIT